MRLRAVTAGLALALLALTTGEARRAEPRTVTALLDAYVAGEYETVLASLDAAGSLKDVLSQFERDGRAWTEAAGPDEVDRRQLAAATVALEAARTGATKEWKLRQNAPRGKYLYWLSPPLLLEWGCALLRDREAPHPDERLWQLAAVSVAQHAGDPEFLIGDGQRTVLLNYGREIEHLRHVRLRFRDEHRFDLAQALAVEWQSTPGLNRGSPREALDLFRQLEDDQDVGAEAVLHAGQLDVRLRDDRRAEDAFDRVESTTRDPWLLYLARFLRGGVLERRNRADDAEAAYRGALAAVPRAQSASVALATLLFRADRRTEASGIIADMLAADPRPVDPWKGYLQGDDRFWPILIGRLREALGQ